MYNVVVSDNRRVIATSLQDELAVAVAYGRQLGRKGNRITIFDSLQDATGEIVNLSEVLTMVLEEDPKSYT